MAKTIEIRIKIISSPIEKIIGWKGNVLEIGLITPTEIALRDFLSDNVGIPRALCSVQEVGSIMLMTMTVKHVENIEALLT